MSSNCFSQAESLYSYKTLSSEEGTLPYRILMPKDYDPQKEYPLILFLHGSGERGSDNEKQLTHGGSYFASDSIRDNYPAIVVFPQCKAGESWNNSRYTISDQVRDFVFPIDIEYNLHQDLLVKLLKQLTDSLAVDRARVYAGGLSMGGMGTFELVQRNPDTFAAAFAICGGAHPEIASRISGTPWWLFHGEDDDVVPARWSEKIYEALLKEGAEVHLTLYPGVKHESWNNAFAEPGLMDWLLSKKLN
jgi:predicted peptidase